MSRSAAGVDALVDAVLTAEPPPDGARAGSALELCDLVLDSYPAPALRTAQLRRLDAGLATALARGTAQDRPALVALCAALSDRLTAGVRGPLRALASQGGPRLAAAAHLAVLLAEGLAPSRQHLEDLAAVGGPDLVEDPAARRRPARFQAMALARALALPEVCPAT